MQDRLRGDLSGVRIHDDIAAASSARDLGAAAWTLGRHVAFGSGAFAPDTESGRRLLAHELAHVVQQGPSGGTGPMTAARVGSVNDPEEREAEQVAASAGTDAPSRSNVRADSAVVRRAVGDFEVGGIETSADVMSIFFDRGSAAIPASQLAKIPAVITAVGAGSALVLDGYASEDEAPALAPTRASAVGTALAAAAPPHTGARTLRDQAALGKGVIEYRTRRKVEVQTRAPMAPPPAPRAPAVITRLCGTALSTARPRALFLLNRAIGALAPPRTAAVDGLLSDLFGGASGVAAAATIKTNLGKVKHHIAVEIGPAGTVACHTELDGRCVNPAYNVGTGLGAVMTLCPDFLDNPGAVNENAATLIHEGAHGTTGVATQDLAYGHTRLIRALSTAQSLTNTDSYVLLVRNIDANIAATPPIPIGVAGDSDAGIPLPANKRAARSALAHAEKWLTQAYQDVASLYDTVVATRAAGVWTGTTAAFDRETMHLLAATFPVTDPGVAAPFALPTLTDQQRLAAVYDRFMAMRQVMWSRGVTMTQVAMGPDAWAASLGSSVNLTAAFFALALPDQVRRLIGLLAHSHPYISVAREPSYVTAADAIRGHRGLGP
jgi:hypothetical protein